MFPRELRGKPGHEKKSSRLFLMKRRAGTVSGFVGRWMIPGAFTSLPLKQFISGAHDECNNERLCRKSSKWLKLCEFQQSHNCCYLFKLCTSAVRGNFKCSVRTCCSKLVWLESVLKSEANLSEKAKFCPTKQTELKFREKRKLKTANVKSHMQFKSNSVKCR